MEGEEAFGVFESRTQKLIIERLIKLKESTNQKYKLVLYDRYNDKIDSSKILSGKELWDNWEHENARLTANRDLDILIGATIVIESEGRK